jgi:hypothetical protein
MDVFEQDKNGFVVPGGTLLKNDKRDHEFPDIYQVDEHPLVTDTTTIKTILIMIVDTSKDGRKKKYEKERTLFVPLGIDSTMESKGIVKKKKFL